ncbi:MAG: cobalamin B12-binding domain-containing protein [Dehalococcoidia bacterium]|nr:cobalamin B12-binding domain-containing protein [Dehalococcoidia bacterium]
MTRGRNVIRVLVAKVGLDGHDRGAKVVAQALRDAGMEVIYTGLRSTPEHVVQTALQEDVHILGLSILSGAHMALTRKVLAQLKEQGADKEMAVVVGGTMPPVDVRKLKEMGAAAVFPMGTAMSTVTKEMQELGKRMLAARENAASPA